MLIARKRSAFLPTFIAIYVFMIYGCASSGIQTPTGEQATNVIDAFERGEARLNCGVSCAAAWGSSRREARELYDQGLWKDLAIHVAKVGFKADQTYFYLGRAAEGLGLVDAALTYYKLGLASAYKCAGIINNCDGLVFPTELISGRNRLPAPAKAETAIVGSANLANLTDDILSKKALIESQPAQVSTPLSKVNPPQVNSRSPEQERQDQETAYALQQEKEAKQQNEADRLEADSTKKARAMIRRATKLERSMIIRAMNQSLFDSGSAKYLDISLIEKSYACVEVNAKNRLGGYTGFQNIVAAYISGSWFFVTSIENNSISCNDVIAKMHIKHD